MLFFCYWNEYLLIVESSCERVEDKKKWRKKTFGWISLMKIWNGKVLSKAILYQANIDQIFIFIIGQILQFFNIYVESNKIKDPFSAWDYISDKFFTMDFISEKMFKKLKPQKI